MSIIIGLDDRTMKLMEDLFKDKKCHECKEPAKRFLKQKFFCHNCLKGSKWGERLYPFDIKEVKVTHREKEHPYRYREVF